MGNLGLYQEFSAIAKSFGGVEELIKVIESDAVKRAAPALLGVGLLVGASAKPAFVATKRGLTKLKESGPAAAEAKEQLRAFFEKSQSPKQAEESPVAEPDGNDTREEK